VKAQVVDAHEQAQKLVSIVKMATVVEGYTTEEKRYVARFWPKGFNAKNIHKEIFPLHGGKCVSRKAIHNCVEKSGKYFTDNEVVEKEVRKWLRQQSKDFYAAGFKALEKRWDKCISVGGGYVEKYIFSPVFYILYPCRTSSAILRFVKSVRLR
jgi:hypothetical protein